MNRNSDSLDPYPTTIKNIDFSKEPMEMRLLLAAEACKSPIRRQFIVLFYAAEYAVLVNNIPHFGRLLLLPTSDSAEFNK